MIREHYIKVTNTNLDIQYIRLKQSEIFDPYLPNRLNYYRKLSTTSSASIVTISVRLPTRTHHASTRTNYR